jgi:hypothetical protein
VTGFRKRAREVDRRRRLADATFLVCDRYDSRHRGITSNSLTGAGTGGMSGMLLAIPTVWHPVIHTNGELFTVLVDM